MVAQRRKEKGKSEDTGSSQDLPTMHLNRSFPLEMLPVSQAPA